MNRTKIALHAAAASAACWLATAPASAQMAHIPANDWRQPDRTDALLAASEKKNFTFEIRFGPYLPNVDGESGLQGTVSKTTAAVAKTPFKDVFGLDCSAQPATAGTVSPRLYFGLEVDYHPVRIPYVGSVGLGVGWGYTRFNNQAAFTNRTKGILCSDQVTSLTIMPMHTSIVLRVDELMRRKNIPIVPYGKFGVGLTYWRASSDSGTETYKACGTTANPVACTGTATPAADAVARSGVGLTPSLHFAAGGMLSLNFLDPRSTARLDESAGIGRIYAFGEYYSDATVLSSSVMHVGNAGWVAGLAVDM
jgi:hypothetical protein